MTLAFFKEVQNKLLWAVSGKTAAELMYYRANASLPMMGLASTEKEGKVTKNDVLIGKNYLNEKEIGQLKLIVEQFLAYAEAQALAEKPMFMSDWVQKLRLVLTMNEKNILEHAGTISHESAVAKATREYIAYKEQQRKIERLESIKQLDQDLKRIAPERTIKKRKTTKRIINDSPYTIFGKSGIAETAKDGILFVGVIERSSLYSLKTDLYHKQKMITLLNSQ